MVERITLAEQHAVNEQRRMGRTDRQAEKIVGLPQGILSRPYLIDDSAERRAAAARKEAVEWSARQDRFWRAIYAPQRPNLQGWRPQHDCITDRPDAGTHHRPRKPA